MAMYSKEVLKRFKNPKHAGEIKHPDIVGEVGNLKCGDIIKVYVKIDKNRIKDIKFETYGCVSAIAASDMLCDLAMGKTIEQAEKLKFKEIIEKLKGLPPIKYHCSMMAIEALQKALKEYKEKQKDKDKIKDINKGQKTSTKKDSGNNLTPYKFTEKTTLAKLPKDMKTQKILGKFGVPCISCPHASSEANSLTLGQVAKMYGLDIKGLLKELNKK